MCLRVKGCGGFRGCRDGNGIEIGGGVGGRTEHGTGAGIAVTTDGLQERVPISSLRVKQGEAKREKKKR